MVINVISRIGYSPNYKILDIYVKCSIKFGYFPNSLFNHFSFSFFFLFSLFHILIFLKIPSIFHLYLYLTFYSFFFGRYIVWIFFPVLGSFRGEYHHIGQGFTIIALAFCFSLKALLKKTPTKIIKTGCRTHVKLINNKIIVVMMTLVH